jgi:hypothetical protein
MKILYIAMLFLIWTLPAGAQTAADPATNAVVDNAATDDDGSFDESDEPEENLSVQERLKKAQEEEQAAASAATEEKPSALTEEQKKKLSEETPAATTTAPKGQAPISTKVSDKNAQKHDWTFKDPLKQTDGGSSMTQSTNAQKQQPHTFGTTTRKY